MRLYRVSIRTFLIAVLASKVLGAGGSVDLSSAARSFAEAKRCSDEDGGRLWGVRIFGPMMFVDPDTREVVTSSPASGSGLTQVGDVYVGRLPETIGIANTAIDWAGVHWAMIRWPLPENESTRMSLLMHESFHRVQPEIGLRLGNPSNAHLDLEQGRVWLRLEWRALKRALLSTGPERKTGALDALTFREYRRSLFPKAKADECLLETNEGLAEYTGVKLAAKSNAAAIDAAVRLIKDNENAPSFTRSFAYTSGPAYGLLLDGLEVEWRKGLTPESDLGLLLRTFYAVDLPSNLESAAKRQAGQYGGDSVASEERRKAEEHRTVVAKYRAKLVEGPVLILPGTGNVRYQFNPSNLIHIDEKNIVYPTITVGNDWGQLQVVDGALMVRSDNGIDRFQVAAPGEVRSDRFQGDGWTLELTPGWKVVPSSRKGDYTLVKLGAYKGRSN